MSCPRCGSINTKVIDSKNNEKQDGIVRRRKCLKCGKRWNTTELYSELIPIKKKPVSLSYKKSVLRELNNYRHQAIEAAKELCYDPSVILKLQSAKTSVQISQIMATAREEKFG